MREISPVPNFSVDEYIALLPIQYRQPIERIRRQKENNERPRPSTTLIDRSAVLAAKTRSNILDQVATLVDENVFGRSEMCRQFADLLMRALVYLELPAHAEVGTVTYYADEKIFHWEHAWVRVGREVIDGNVDSLFENPMVPSFFKINPYWGPIKKLPKGRIFSWKEAKALPMGDMDVSNIWWPELKNWLDQNVTLDQNVVKTNGH